MLSDRQYRFVIEYCKESNGTKAAISVGYSERSAGSIASEILTKPEVIAAIENHRKDLAGQARVNAAFVAEKLRQIADSDRPRCCRYCYGIDHRYQWTKGEYSKELGKALNAGSAIPEMQGGFGFTKDRDPHPECAECYGDGVLYRLPSEDKDRLKALDLLQKQFALQTERRELSGPGGGPIQTDNRIPREMTTAELMAFLQTDELGGGTIEGTFVEVDANPKPLNELEAPSSP